ncbi:hypothetical protein ZWY2020_020592 [Hordeum vulgare]|nr:hypothetical protein ZWY2020_020592 [Hordeum vulgare]
MATTTTIEDVPSVELMTELLRRAKCSSKPDKRIILVGPPGSGKGTQSPLIKDEYCLCHLATGDMLRAAVAAKTPLGIKAKEAMDKVGTVVQAQKLDEMLAKQDSGVDDVSGEPLIQRKDDTSEVLKSRLEAFHIQTEPVIDYYSKNGLVANLHAEKPPKEVTAEVQKALS